MKPAKRLAAKTVAADNMVRSLRAFSEAHAGEVITVICELSLAKAGEKIMTNATVSRITAMQYRTASILIFLDGCIIVTNDDFKDDSKRRSGLGLFISIDADQRISPYISDLILPGTKGLTR